VEDGLGVEVALGRGLAPQAEGLVGHPHVEGIAVQVRVDRDRRDAQLPAGAHDSYGDLAAVGDQELLEQGASLRLTVISLQGCPMAAPNRGSGRTDSSTCAGSTPSTRPTVTCWTRPARAPPKASWPWPTRVRRARAPGPSSWAWASTWPGPRSCPTSSRRRPPPSTTRPGAGPWTGTSSSTASWPAWRPATPPSWGRRRRRRRRGRRSSRNTP